MAGQQLLGVLGIELVGFVEVLDAKHLIHKLSVVVEIAVGLLSDLHRRPGGRLDHFLGPIKFLQYFVGFVSHLG